MPGEIGCDHMRAYLLYIISLDFSPRGTFFLARPCDSWSSYENGSCSCGKRAQFMGMNVNTELKGNFYLKTKAAQPYAMQDPECPTFHHSSAIRRWNIFIVVGYVIVASFVLCCVFSVLILVVENIRRTCCSSPKDDEDPLYSSSDDDDDDDEDDDEEEEDVDDGEPEGDEEDLVKDHGGHFGCEKDVTVSIVSGRNTSEK